MTDISLLEYWKERLDNELKAGEKSDSKEIQREKATVRFQLWELIKRYNDLEKDEVRIKWHWWWQYNLAKRILRKFKIKNIYKNEKATDEWRYCYQNKRCKIALHPLSKWGKEEMIGFLYQTMEQDLPNRHAYLTVIDKIKQL